MKKLLLLSAMAIFTIAANAQIKTPAPSPTQTIKQDFALSNIELSYSRPGIKDRKIYVDLAPDGKLWRTGANAATTLTFGDEVIIGGKKIPAGKYGLLSIPSKNSWTLIITKQTDVTSGSDGKYKESEDVVRVIAKPSKLSPRVETFTIQFANIKNASCDLQIMWDDVLVTLPITADIDAKIMASIDNSLQSEKPSYMPAAVYYLENGKDLNKANDWIAKAVQAQPEAYWVRYQQARILAKMGKKAEARTAAQKSMELATNAKNADYVELNKKLISGLGK